MIDRTTPRSCLKKWLKPCRASASRIRQLLTGYNRTHYQHDIGSLTKGDSREAAGGQGLSHFYHGLLARLPEPSVDGSASPIDLGSYRWRKHCRGMFQTPIAADFRNSPPTRSKPLALIKQPVGNRSDGLFPFCMHSKFEMAVRNLPFLVPKLGG